MAWNERGMALVSVILMLTVLLALAHLLCEKVWQSSRQVADAARREQIFWAAQAGVEEARQRLSATYVSSRNWQDYLVSTTVLSYPSVPAWVIDINGIPVDVFLRDNPDGDGDPGTDNDLKLYVLGRARGLAGGEVMIEVLCGLEPFAANSLSQSGQVSASSHIDLSDQPVNTYDIAE